MSDCDSIRESVSTTMDVRGMVCSKPIIKARIQMKKIKAGQTIEILTNDKTIGDILRVFRMKSGFTFLECPGSDHKILYITKIET
jgi:TusA-related sulfurtransferase